MSIRHLAIHTPRDAGWIAPGSEQHAAMISPSKVAAILGLSRWESPYSLWHRMKNLVPPDPPKDIYTAGHQFEHTAAQMWRDDNPGWKLSPDEVQFVVDPDHFGFPAMVTLDRRAVRGRARRVVEFKIAREMSDLEKWGDDLTGDAPPDYTAQVSAEMLFTGMTRLPGHLLAIGPFYDHRIYTIEYDASVAAWMITEIRKFWESLAAETPPPLDNSVATYETVRKLHPEIDPDTSIDLDPDVAFEFLQAHAEKNAAEKRLTGAKSAVLSAMGENEIALVGAHQIAKRTPHASGSVALTKARKITAADILEGTPA